MSRAPTRPTRPTNKSQLWRLDGYFPFNTVIWANHVKADMDVRLQQAVVTANPEKINEEVSAVKIIERDSYFVCLVKMFFPDSEWGKSMVDSAAQWLESIAPFMVQPNPPKVLKGRMTVHKCNHEVGGLCDVDYEWELP